MAIKGCPPGSAPGTHSAPMERLKWLLTISILYFQSPVLQSVQTPRLQFREHRSENPRNDPGVAVTAQLCGEQSVEHPLGARLGGERWNLSSAQPGGASRSLGGFKEPSRDESTATPALLGSRSRGSPACSRGCPGGFICVLGVLLLF